MNIFNTLSKAISSALLLCAIFVSTSSIAQPNVDITLVDNGNNELEVRVRPDGPFDGIFSSLVFTIKWATVDGADLGAIQQGLPELGYIPTNKSGDQTDTLGDRYQIFAGFGFNPLSTFGASWTANTEYAIMTIPVLNNSSTFEIVNDAWTAGFNGDYYVSLAGQNKTGIIYPTISTSVPMGPQQDHFVNIVPNPNQGEFTMEFITDHSDDYIIELVNSVGQVIYTKQLDDFSGEYRYEFDLSAESAGVYFLKITGEKDNSVHRVVVK